MCVAINPQRCMVASFLPLSGHSGGRQTCSSLDPVAIDPKATFGAQLTVRLENLPPHLSLPAVLGSLLGDQVLAT